jgi:hypothetical protein
MTGEKCWWNSWWSEMNDCDGVTCLEEGELGRGSVRTNNKTWCEDFAGNVENVLRRQQLKPTSKADSDQLHREIELT